MAPFLTPFRSKKAPKILFVSSEAAPFARVGGLASVMYSLPKALSELGYDVRIMMPRYLSINDAKYHLTMEFEGLQVPTDNNGNGPDNIICNVKRCEPDESNGAGVTSY